MSVRDSNKKYIITDLTTNKVYTLPYIINDYEVYTDIELKDLNLLSLIKNSLDSGNSVNISIGF